MKGAIIQGRIAKCNFGDKPNTSENDERFSVILKCKKRDLNEHNPDLIEDANFDREEIHPDDLINYNMKLQDEQA